MLSSLANECVMETLSLEEPKSIAHVVSSLVMMGCMTPSCGVLKRRRSV